MGFDDYLTLVDDIHAANPEWRMGQTASNVLHTVRGDLYGDVPCAVDPFFNDDRLDAFYTWCRSRWEE
jgi:hypothetical protein